MNDLQAQKKKRSVLSYALAAFYVVIVLVVFYYSPIYQYVILKQQMDELLLLQNPSDDEQKQLEQLLRNDNLIMEDRLLIVDRLLELLVEMNMASVPDALIYVVENEEFDDEVRKTVLAETAKPIIVTRDAYRTDRRVYVKFVNRSGRLNNHRVETSVKYPRGGSTGSGRNQHFGGGSSTTSWQINGEHAPPYEPGIYDESVTHTVKFYKGASSTRINPDDETPLFEIEQEILFKIQIKNPEEADQVIAVTGADLDEKMKAAYTEGPQSGAKFLGRSNYDELQIHSINLPFSVAFEFVFVDQDGVEHSMKTSINNFVNPDAASTSHGWNTSFAVPSITQPGTYTGKLIFRASEEVAFGNPQITEYWGGEFDVPFTFTLPDDGDLFKGKR
ncbi:MAG: hypothetical protein P9L94_04885 [Candidatus Hinthialibacter antarcticus]|nr:hypothetical protein [Candidatus Hinthialibacter antarcticus]